MAKKRKSRKPKSGCKSGTVKFKTKRGKTIEFAGRMGPSCGPRKKPSTAHLRHYKTALASAARSCGRKKLARRAFLNCVSSGMPK